MLGLRGDVIMEYIIELQRACGTEYICGGTYKIGEYRYAKCSHLFLQAKKFRSKRQAQREGERLAKRCRNVKGIFFIKGISS